MITFTIGYYLFIKNDQRQPKLNKTKFTTRNVLNNTNRHRNTHDAPIFYSLDTILSTFIMSGVTHYQMRVLGLWR